MLRVLWYTRVSDCVTATVLSSGEKIVMTILGKH